MIRLNIPHTIIAVNIEEDLCKQLNQMEIVWLNDAVILLTTSQDKINDLLDVSAVVNRTFTSHLQLSNTFFSTYNTAEIIRILLIKIVLNVLTHTEQG
ncbi:MAG TPA: hypothetical protein DIS98_13855, partial [Colwellia sp.]|nr:hypothetical protein [Colwellia sp.]